MWLGQFTYAINRLGTKRVVLLVTHPQYKDPREWHGPVAGFLVDQFWEVYSAGYTRGTHCPHWWLTGRSTVSCLGLARGCPRCPATREPEGLA